MKRAIIALCLAALAACSDSDTDETEIPKVSRPEPAAPVLQIASPADGAELPFGPVVIEGRAVAEAGIESLVRMLDGGAAEPVAVEPDGDFAVTLEPGAGAHTLRLVLRDRREREASAEVQFTVLAGEPAAPSIVLSAPAGGAELPFGPVTVEGRADAEAGIASFTVAVDGGAAEAVDVGADGAFSVAIEVEAGAHTLRFVLVDALDREAVADLAFTLLPAPDVTAPALEIVAPWPETPVRRVVLRGTASDDRALAGVRILHGEDERTVEVNEDGSFAAVVVPFRGANEVVFIAADETGNETRQTVSFFYGQTTTAGGAHTGVIRDGQLYAFGRNNKGQVGWGGPMTDDDSPYSPQLVSLPPVHWVSFAQLHSVAVGLDGSLWTWGEGEDGQNGLGSDDDDAAVAVNTPQRVPGIDNAVAAAAGYDHTLVLLDDGTVIAFGSNVKGQLGDGTTTTRYRPTPVSGLSGIVKVAAGSNHSVALREDGAVFLFGSNAQGNLAQGTSDGDPHPLPVQAVGLRPAIDIATGKDHVLALHEDGTLSAWGQGGQGQLGDGRGTNSSTPVTVNVLDDVVGFTANGNYSLALRSDGTVWGWGQGFNNQFGVDENGNWVEPRVPAFGLTGVVSVAAGATHAVAIDREGDVYTWGWNFYGSLGNPLFTNRWAVPFPATIELPTSP